MIFNTSAVAVCCCRVLAARATLLHVVEQPHVLDRDHRLVGERGEQLDLLVGEWPHRRNATAQHANRSSFAQQGDAEHRSDSPPTSVHLHSVFRIGKHIKDMHRSAFEQRSTGHV